jgi:hypothetical protein
MATRTAQTANPYITLNETRSSKSRAYKAQLGSQLFHLDRLNFLKSIVIPSNYFKFHCLVEAERNFHEEYSYSK